jgi:hypothetical protein
MTNEIYRITLRPLAFAEALEARLNAYERHKQLGEEKPVTSSSKIYEVAVAPAVIEEVNEK